MKQLLAIVLGAALTACLPITTSSTYTPQVTQVEYNTGVYINGSEISAADKAQLETLLGGPLPPGRYFVLSNGDAGVEGQPASVNLYALQEQRDAGTAPADQHTSFYGTGAGGQSQSITRDGDCVMFSSPDVDFAGSGC